MAYLAHVVTVIWCVCYCLSNSYAIVFRHNRRFSYRRKFQDRQKPHPLISRRAVRIRHSRPRIKSRRKLSGRQWELNPKPSEQLRPKTIKTSVSTETATAIYQCVYVCTRAFMHVCVRVRVPESGKPVCERECVFERFIGGSHENGLRDPSFFPLNCRSYKLTSNIAHFATLYLVILIYFLGQTFELCALRNFSYNYFAHGDRDGT